MTDRPEVQVLRLDPEMSIPQRARPGDSGVDLRAAQDVSIKPGERCLIPTGLALAIPDGFAGYVQPRSGLAINAGLGLLNSPGLIDSGYRGEIKVIAINLDSEDVIHIRRGERIAQLVVLAVPESRYVEVTELPDSDRGAGGFGSSGIG